MHLLFITNTFPNPIQPTRGAFNAAMAEGLAAEHDVSVISPVSWTAVARAGRATRRGFRHSMTVAGGVEVHHPTFVYPSKLFRGWHSWFFCRSIQASVRRVLVRRSVDAVLGYWAYPDGEAALRAARLAGVPGLVMVGGSDVLLSTERSGQRELVRRVLHEADAVVAVSEHLAVRVAQLGIDRGKVHVVRRGVDRTTFAPGDRSESRRRLGVALDRPMLVWAGRMVPVKGLDCLLEACGRLQSSGIDHRLYLVGDGPLRNRLIADVARRGLADRVTMVGPVAHVELADWYRAADLTVLPSRSEGVPNVLLESIACGTPFVASRVGGIAEIATEGIDRLVPPGDARALADATHAGLATTVATHERVFRPSHQAAAARQLVEVVQQTVALARCTAAKASIPNPTRSHATENSIGR